jgi:YYY domain-containing protein
MEYGVVALWWVMYAALAVAGLPIAAVLFSRLEGRGAAFALPVSLVVLFTSVYWIGRVTFGPVAVAAAGGILIAVSVATYLRLDPEIDTRRVGGWFAVFSAAFFLLVAVRAVDPAIQPAGGEKFLDFGLLRTILRDTSLPPEDMWFAGEAVQYYYGGHLLSAILTTMSGTAPKYGYNLALAGFYAALVSTAFGLAGSIAASRGASYRKGGLFGALFVGVASNLVPTLQVVLMTIPGGIASFVGKRFANGALSLQELTAPFASETSTPYYWIPSRAIDGTITEFPLFAWLNGDLHAHMMSTPFLLLLSGVVFAYYLTPEEALRRRRLLLFGVAPPVAGMIAVVNTWSFPSTAGVAFLGVLFAGSDPWTLVAGADGTLRWPAWLPDAPRRWARSSWRAVRGWLGRLAVRTRTDGVVGWVRRRIYALVALVNGTEWGRELKRTVTALLVGGGVLVVSAIWVLPFLVGPAVGAEGRSIGLVPDQTGWSGILLVHGWVLAVFAAYLAARVTDRASGTAGTVIAATVAVLVVLTVIAGAPAFAFLAPLFLVAWLTLRRGDALGFESVLFVGGAGLVLLVEVIYLRELAGSGRFNTVFKTYMQVWVLWGTAAGVALAVLTPTRPMLAVIDGAATSLMPGGDGSDPMRLRKQAAAVLSVLLVVSVSMYAPLALGVHFENNHFSGSPDQPDAPPLTTDLGAVVNGTDAFVDDSVTYLGYVFTDPSLDATGHIGDTFRTRTEAPAISWLDDREGKPTIVTAAPAGYSWNPRAGNGASAPSSLTGIPTVLGWFHERGYRGNGPYQERLADVETIYTGSPAERAALLSEYGVEYVYAGPAEVETYGASNVAAFGAMAGVSTAESWGPDMVIYRVNQSELSAG